MMENVLQNTQHDVDTLQLSYFGTLFFSYFPDRVQSSKFVIIVGTIKTIKHKLSIAFQTDMHNNNNQRMTQVTLAHFGYPVDTLWVYCSQTF